MCTQKCGGSPASSLLPCRADRGGIRHCRRRRGAQHVWGAAQCRARAQIRFCAADGEPIRQVCFYRDMRGLAGSSRQIKVKAPNRHLAPSFSPRSVSKCAAGRLQSLLLTQCGPISVCIHCRVSLDVDDLVAASQRHLGEAAAAKRVAFLEAERQGTSDSSQWRHHFRVTPPKIREHLRLA